MRGREEMQNIKWGLEEEEENGKRGRCQVEEEEGMGWVFG